MVVVFSLIAFVVLALVYWKGICALYEWIESKAGPTPAIAVCFAVTVGLVLIVDRPDDHPNDAYYSEIDSFTE